MNEENKLTKEVTETQQCCCLLPLRYGLIPWGYFKMVVAAICILVISYSLLHTLMLLSYNANEKFLNRVYADIAITIFALILFVTDLFLTILYMFGGYKENVKMLRAFYFYSAVIYSVTILLYAMAVSLSVESWLSHYATPRSLVINWVNFSAYFAILVVQTYFVLLLRNEIIKWRHKREFIFENDAIEATCTMKCEENAEGNDTETEDD